ncbi:MAG: hypothetical protein KAJ95_10050, partial [Gammaproteobacteria bacterium]|nr:hypothetical protein [Gammaproteobacteria bacterium]
YIEYMIKHLLNTQAKGTLIPRDVIHLFIIAAASLFAVFLFLAIPLFISKSRNTHWRGKNWSLLYFSCLGAGFIIVELVFIQIFMKLVGYPLYTYSTVVFGLLLAAGIGSYLSGKLEITPQSRWLHPFAGMFISIILFLLVYQDLFAIFLAWPVLARSIMAILMMFPIGLFMGMLFPLGILLLKDEPQGSVAWAWAMNGLFTVIGGLLSVLLSIYLGFTITMIIALLIYVLGLFAFSRFRDKVYVGTLAS